MIELEKVCDRLVEDTGGVRVEDNKLPFVKLLE